MSKQSKIKKQLAQSAKQKPVQSKPTVKREYTMEERAAAVRDRLANRPVFVFRSRNGKLNRRFLFTMALMIVAFAVCLYFLSKW